jgi:hypothetical protein
MEFLNASQCLKVASLGFWLKRVSNIACLYSNKFIDYKFHRKSGFDGVLAWRICFSKYSKTIQYTVSSAKFRSRGLAKRRMKPSPALVEGCCYFASPGAVTSRAVQSCGLRCGVATDRLGLKIGPLSMRSIMQLSAGVKKSFSWLGWHWLKFEVWLIHPMRSRQTIDTWPILTGQFQY